MSFWGEWNVSTKSWLKESTSLQKFTNCLKWNFPPLAAQSPKSFSIINSRGCFSHKLACKIWGRRECFSPDWRRNENNFHCLMLFAAKNNDGEIFVFFPYYRECLEVKTKQEILSKYLWVWETLLGLKFTQLIKLRIQTLLNFVSSKISSFCFQTKAATVCINFISRSSA